MIKVLIADDHTIVREGLKQILSETQDIKVLGEANNGSEIFPEIEEKDFDVLVLDITMPGRSGLDVLKQVKAIQPQLHILVLSMHPEDQYAIRVLRAGASGYLTKESASEQLISAIRKVAEGRKYISPTLAEKLASELNEGVEKPPHERLSDREYQVMCLLASGKTVKEISEELLLSVKTISTYRQRILQKMKLKNNAELSIYAIKQCLIC
jgi:DNA-binding NarL/FixJ family response regulator